MQAQTSSTGAANTPDPVIPAVEGEFYRYTTEFTMERPLGFLMDCKANKGRSVTDAADHPTEHDLTFLFGDTVGVCSPYAPPSIELLNELAVLDELHETRIARVNMAPDAFSTLRDNRSGQTLVDVVRAAVPIFQAEQVFTLAPGLILAVMTDTHKFGLLRILEVTPTSVSIEGIHILLP